MSEETGHSALLKAMIGNDDRTLVFSLPYIKENIPIGIVFKALGFYDQEDIKNLIALSSPKIDKYIKLIDRDSFFCLEQSDGFSLFYETTKQDLINDNFPAKGIQTEIEKRWADLVEEEKSYMEK